jgi:putative lipoprotein
MRCVLISVAAACLGLGGCVVDQMRNDLRSTKSSVTQMEQIIPTLEGTNELLRDVSAKLAQTNANLEKMQGTLESVSTSLVDVDAKLLMLAKLEPMDKTLANLDSHLASLRGTLASIDESMPFLGLNASEPAPAAPGPDGKPAAALPTAPAVSGVASYRAKIALPPTAVLIARIEDATDDDAPVLIAESRTPTTGKQVPLAFRVAFDPAAVTPQREYRVVVSVEDGGRTIWRASKRPRVLEAGKASEGVQVLLEQAK